MKLTGTLSSIYKLFVMLIASDSNITLLNKIRNNVLILIQTWSIYTYSKDTNLKNQIS